MKIDLQVKQNEETKDNSVTMLPEDENILSPGTMPFYKMMEEFNALNETSGEISAVSDFDFKYDTLSMSEDDAKFFINLAQNGEFISVPNGETEFKLIKTEVAQNSVIAKSVEVTGKLTELIQKAQNTQKPVRIAFDNDVSVVLRIDKNGKVTAEFIPGSLEAENYLRSNIASLRQKFDEQNLPYNDLFYRDGSKREKQNKKRNKGE